MILDAVEFACLCERWQASLDVKIDPEIIGHIYNACYLPNYDNYTLLELIYELHIARVQILCQWNKKAILAMIKEFRIELPEKSTPSRPTVWQHNINGYNLDTIYIYDTDFEFRTGDIIQFSSDGPKYKIEIEVADSVEAYDVQTVNVYLIDLETTDEHCITGKEFVEILDNSEDITIIQNIDRHYFM